MLEKIREIDTSAIEKLIKIKKEQDRLADFRRKADEIKDTVDAAIYRRVRADYESRESALEEEAIPLKAEARGEYEKLCSIYDQLKEALEQALGVKQELEFRHAVQEFDKTQLADKLKEPERAIEQCQSQLGEADGLKAQFLSAFRSEDDLTIDSEGQPEVNSALQPELHSEIHPEFDSEIQPEFDSVRPSEVESEGQPGVESRPQFEAIEIRDEHPIPAPQDDKTTVLQPESDSEIQPQFDSVRPSEVESEGQSEVESRPQFEAFEIRDEHPIPAPQNDKTTVLQPESDSEIHPEFDSEIQPEFDSLRPSEVESEGQPEVESRPEFEAIEIRDEHPIPAPQNDKTTVRPLSEAPEGTTVQLKAKLVRVEQGEPSDEYPLRAINHIGRAEGNTIRILSPTVSRKHALVTASTTGFTVKDLESRSGIFVNEEKISEYDLANGDRVQLGDVELIFRLL